MSPPGLAENQTMTIILHVPTFALLSTVGYRPLIAINTVYDDGYRMVKGCQYTAATILGQPSPCNNPAIPIIPGGAIALGNIELGSIAGALRAVGANSVWADQYRSFWNLVAHVEFYGMHKYAECRPITTDVESLYAWRAWEYAYKPEIFHNKVTDVTDYIDNARYAIDAILRRADLEMIGLGYRLKEAEIAIRESTFCMQEGPVVLRKTEGPMYHRDMMYLPTANVLVTYDTLMGQIILSVARPNGLDCLAMMKTAGLKNPEGGKHLAFADGHSWEDTVEFAGVVAINTTRNVYQA